MNGKNKLRLVDSNKQMGYSSNKYKAATIGEKKGE